MSLKDLVDSSALATHLGDAKDLGRRWFCPGCGSAQVVDEDLRYPLHSVNLAKLMPGGGSMIEGSAFCGWSFTMVECARQERHEQNIEREFAFFEKMAIAVSSPA